MSDMINRIPPILSLWLCISLVTACQPASPLPAALAKDEGRAKDERDIKMVVTCDVAVREGQRIVETDTLVVRNSKLKSLCVDDAESIRFRPDFARLHLFKDGGASIDLECRDAAMHSEFYQRHSGRDVVLMAGETALGVFSTAAPISGLKCGRFNTQDFETAASLCEAFTAHWGSSSDHCFEICEPSMDVCIEPSA